MRIASIRLKNFKRFTDLEIAEIPKTAKLVVVVGPNGCGKSSLFDALLHWYRMSVGLGYNSDLAYYKKILGDAFDWGGTVQVARHEDGPLKKGALYLRTAYRNDPDFSVDGINRPQNPTEGVRVGRSIDNDQTVSDNYRRLIYDTMAGVYDAANDQKTVLALDSSALMFSFLSPASTRSAWINFEAGYAYARGVKVVPVAILGQDLNALNPPLSLLQGFNLRSHEGMNNILSVINATFNTSYPLAFAKVDYSGTFTSPDEVALAFFGGASNLIKRVSMEVLADGAAFDVLAAELEAHHKHVFKEKQRCAASGVEIRSYQSDKGQAIEINVAPALFELNISILRKCASLANADDRKLCLSIAPHTRFSETIWELTAKFHGTSIQPFGNRFVLEGVAFEFITRGFIDRSGFDGDDCSPVWAIAIDASALDQPQVITRILDQLIKLKILAEEPDVPF